MKIKEYLKENILLFDGAMGSYFAGIHNDPLYPCEFANITSPHTISEIHKRYLVAGAKAIKTNTFSLPHGEDSPFSAQEIIESGYKLAKEQAEHYNAYVFADISITPITGEDNPLPYYMSIIDIFLEQGAENFLFETCISGEFINELASYIKDKCENSFILASFAVGVDGFTKTGRQAKILISELSDMIDATGFNCICGPYHMLELVKEIHSDKIFSIMPNASYPTVAGNRMNYSQNPTYFAEQMMKIAEKGCLILGGCCGTTPEFISQLNNRLSAPLPKKKRSITQNVATSTTVVKSDFYEKLKAGKKPIAVELDTPVKPNITEYMSRAKQLKDVGVDLITIADCPVARPRLDSSLMASKLKRELGIHAMPHMTCRDRNINAAKALLLGLSVEEVNNVLVITGDPIPQEQRKEIKTVYEFNSRMLIKNINLLNESLFTSAPFYLYGALNINAYNFKNQLRMAHEKAENGAVALFTQPVMSLRGYENLKIAKKELNIPLVTGIFPATSYRNICFLSNEISGFHVEEELSELYKDKTPEECSNLAVSVSNKIIQEIAEYTDGFYLITPFNRVDLITEIIKQI